MRAAVAEYPHCPACSEPYEASAAAEMLKQATEKLERFDKTASPEY